MASSVSFLRKRGKRGQQPIEASLLSEGFQLSIPKGQLEGSSMVANGLLQAAGWGRLSAC